MAFKNDPTTQVDDRAFLTQARSDAWLWPGIIALITAGSLFLSWRSPDKDIRIKAVDLLGAMTMGVFGYMKGRSDGSHASHWQPPPPTIDMGPSPGGYRPLSPRPMPPDAIVPGWPNPGPELDPPERSSDAWEGRRVGFRPPGNQAQATYDAAMASKAFKRLKDAAMALGDEFKLED